MNFPSDLKYAKTDEWVKVEGKVATIGISDYAQAQLSDIVYVDIALAVGQKATKGSTFASVESVKAAADVNLPVSGKVVAVNADLSKTPEVINSDPFGKAWLLKVELDSPADVNDLMDAAAYEKYCDGRGH
jgi:glycine cleavage system H protein